MRITSNRDLVLKRYNRAFKATANAFYVANQHAIARPHYWEGFEGRVTHRSNGSTVVGAFRDIRDTSSLYGSQSMTIKGSVATLSWDGNGQTPVTDVFFGRRTEYGWIPGRDWIEVALESVDLAAMFKDNF